MKVQVLETRRTPKGLALAVVRAGNKVGEVLADASVTQTGPGELRPELRVQAGRMSAVLKVYQNSES